MGFLDRVLNFVREHKVLCAIIALVLAVFSPLLLPMGQLLFSVFGEFWLFIAFLVSISFLGKKLRRRIAGRSKGPDQP